MKSKTTFRREKTAKPSKNSYVTNKTEVSFKDDTRSRDSLHLKNHRPKVIEGFGYLLEVIDKCSNFERTIP